LVDSVLVDSVASYNYIENVLSIKPDSTIKSIIKIKKLHSIIAYKDSVIYITLNDEGKTMEVDHSTPIVAANKNLYVEYEENYIPDEWTSSFALPVKKEWIEIHIESEVLDSIINLHKTIEELWTIQR
jgi:hypothetical protein